MIYMKQIIKSIIKNKKVIEGEKIQFNGETIIIGKMNEEEIKNFLKEGQEILENKITLRGEKIKLGNIKSGKMLFNITEKIALKGNYSAMWYAWREKRIEEKKKELTPQALKELEELISKMEEQ